MAAVSGDPLQCTWTILDEEGNSYSSGVAANGASVTVTPNGAGTWTVQLTVTHTALGASTVVSETFTVKPAAPHHPQSGHPTKQAPRFWKKEWEDRRILELNDLQKYLAICDLLNKHQRISNPD
jgi:hypothetical protein